MKSATIIIIIATIIMITRHSISKNRPLDLLSPKKEMKRTTMTTLKDLQTGRPKTQ